MHKAKKTCMWLRIKLRLNFCTERRAAKNNIYFFVEGERKANPSFAKEDHYFFSLWKLYVASGSRQIYQNFERKKTLAAAYLFAEKAWDYNLEARATYWDLLIKGSR